MKEEGENVREEKEGAGRRDEGVGEEGAGRREVGRKRDESESESGGPTTAKDVNMRGSLVR
jgi:hypothetical protein